jgi:outer membrane protein OmpA-like peptidoglycan-associated protein
MSYNSLAQEKSFTYSDSVFQVGQEMDLDIRFHSGRLLVDTLSLGRMDSLANFITSHPNITFEVALNTDYRGDSTYNLKVCESRSLSLKSWLVASGVNENQIVTKSNGENIPATLRSDNTFIYDRLPEEFRTTESYSLTETFINQFKSDRKLYEDLHELNRRTVLRIISID